jgi:2'-5' RNA ligase
MKPTTYIDLQHYAQSSYLLILQPHEALFDKIMELKKRFAEKYKIPEAAFAKPHITLVSFKQYTMMEQKIIHRFSTIATHQVPIKIELQNFGSFPSHTIFINVATKTPIQDLVKNIRSHTQKLLKMDEENKPHFIMESHITIARKLQPWQYEKAWVEYTHTHFLEKFMASHILLLKKSSTDQYWKTLCQFDFKGMSSIVKQSSLFI